MMNKVKWSPVRLTNLVEMTLKSTSDWSSEEKARQFVDILVSEGGFLLPEKFDTREPERFVFDVNDLSKFYEMWTSNNIGFGLKSKIPYLSWVDIHVYYKESKLFNEISSIFDERYFKDEGNIDKLLSCAKRLYDWGNVTHGYIYHCEEWEMKNQFDVPTVLADGGVGFSSGTRLDEGLPGIYWANFFGPVYIDFFGRKKFETVPAYRKEELPDGGFFVLTCKSPFDYGQPEVRRLEERIIDHLGRKAFFEKSRPKKICKVPKFTFEQKALGHPVEVIAYDPVTEAIPDPSHFVQEASQLSDELVESFKGKLDYSPESLDKVDDFILKKSYRQPEPWKKEKWRRLIQMLTAYYGEVLRRNLHGKWLVRKVEKDVEHPTVVFLVDQQEEDEYPFARVDKLWSERERADGLVVRYHLLARGEIRKVSQFFAHFLK